MPVTAKDVARELELSQPTVSRILNGDENHRASEATRQRVWEAAQRLGYQPNAVARSLRRGRTDIIGVHTSHNYDVRNDFLGTVVGALQCACAEQHLDVMLHSGVHGSPAEKMFGKLRDGRVDGLILHASVDDPLIALINNSPLPVVAVADVLPGIPSVTCDDETGMRQLVELIISRGHKKFVFLAPKMRLTSVERRVAIFEQELKRHGVSKDDYAVKRIVFEDSAPVLDELLLEKPLAVCCWNDRTAYNLLGECFKRGVSIPAELAVTGFDGFRDDKLPARQLVSVRCPWEDVATKALKILVQLIEKRGENDAKSSFSAPYELRLPSEILDGDTV